MLDQTALSDLRRLLVTTLSTIKASTMWHPDAAALAAVPTPYEEAWINDEAGDKGIDDAVIELSRRMEAVAFHEDGAIVTRACREIALRVDRHCGNRTTDNLREWAEGNNSEIGVPPEISRFAGRLESIIHAWRERHQQDSLRQEEHRAIAHGVFAHLLGDFQTACKLSSDDIAARAKLSLEAATIFQQTERREASKAGRTPRK